MALSKPSVEVRDSRGKLGDRDNCPYEDSPK